VAYFNGFADKGCQGKLGGATFRFFGEALVLIKKIPEILHIIYRKSPYMYTLREEDPGSVDLLTNHLLGPNRQNFRILRLSPNCILGV
jgi:hypothetical protein